MKNRYSCLMPVAMLFSDTVALLCAGAISVWLRYIFNGQFQLSFYWQMWPVLIFFLSVYAFAGLYPGVLISPPEELKKLSLASSLCFLALAAVTFMSRRAELYSRGIFLMAWFLVLFLVPIFRAGTREIFSKKAWWGFPAVVFGAGKTGGMIVHTFQLRPGLGIKPVAIVDDDSERQGENIHGIKVVGGLEEAVKLAQKTKNLIAIMAMPGVGRKKLQMILEKYAQGFRRIVLVPDLFGVSTLWVSVLDLGGILGLDLRQNLLDPKRRRLKRCVDLAIVISSGVLVLPLMLFIGLAIKLDSKGPVFYRHKRIGLGGREIYIWKFRTMFQNADELLKEYLRKRPDLQREWEMYQKLTNDPRVTKIGRFLRRTSLDELPQLWNVLKGELSLVGPRPIIRDEIKKYKEAFELYKKVRPGVTGLWQISGRNETSYDERVNLDVYYIRNWSIWFDIYILVRTPIEVLRCRGAY
ncbi:undecaprenyl-phosphate galactose phosphotransferase WbaP [Desulfohalobiaceae bacterium Ax17]|uniref:undecaprenyl-phosphate galactose phosphotransferase WbaP n=1 Tax=Desulfovulcanus ferrireducens TaxID=2831190 RepID=UPI00207BC1CD|nr:undecaprenyl-phosphate galactose phosphotransferase WbaP [Desulfovulcanus ferrireducens]MBT8764375.1 undecaprenyl-phosphate galactose phosphotransferase WbaP [Desulfovulcanus ferrireducens]